MKTRRDDEGTIDRIVRLETEVIDARLEAEDYRDMLEGLRRAHKPGSYVYDRVAPLLDKWTTIRDD